MADTTKPTCDICGGDIEPVGDWTHGNNAAPFEGRACDDCNARYVIPARLAGASDNICALVKRFAELGRVFVELAK